ncbi:caldesmon-like [Penaeus vannamei]|uniref:caldesmon-like n=1 Tax=Penaeus vannamei TaxID=6689 RepID=UPI00387F7B05
MTTGGDRSGQEENRRGYVGFRRWIPETTNRRTSEQENQRTIEENTGTSEQEKGPREQEKGTREQEKRTIEQEKRTREPANKRTIEPRAPANKGTIEPAKRTIEPANQEHQRTRDPANQRDRTGEATEPTGKGRTNEPATQNRRGNLGFGDEFPKR